MSKEIDEIVDKAVKKAKEGKIKRSKGQSATKTLRFLKM